MFVRLCGHNGAEWNNGFQDRPVVTTSVTLRVCSLPNGRKQRYKIVLELLLEMPGTGSHRHCKNPVFVRLCGQGGAEWNNGFQDRPVMTTSVTLHIKLGKVYPLLKQGINLAQKEGFEPSRALYTPTPLAGVKFRPSASKNADLLTTALTVGRFASNHPN